MLGDLVTLGPPGDDAGGGAACRACLLSALFSALRGSLYAKLDSDYSLSVVVTKTIFPLLDASCILQIMYFSGRCNLTA